MGTNTAILNLQKESVLKRKKSIHQRGKSMKQKLLEMVHVSVPIFIYFDEI